jgi:two-component system response regulator DesR
VLKRLRQAAPSTAAAAVDWEGFTARDRDVLRRLAAGATNREIAADLALSEGTVKNYISTVLAKSALHDRTQLARFAVRHGFARPPETST